MCSERILEMRLSELKGPRITTLEILQGGTSSSPWRRKKQATVDMVEGGEKKARESGIFELVVGLQDTPSRGSLGDIALLCRGLF